MQIIEIQKLTEAFSAEHRNLVDVIKRIEAEIAAVRRKYMGTLIERVSHANNAKALVVSALEQSKELFEKPRTRTFDGVKVGYQKQKGEIVIQDEPGTIAKLQKLLGDEEAAHYLNVKTTVKKSAVNDMPAEILKKVGIKLDADTDAIVIKPLNSDIEKLVAELLDLAETKEAA